MWIVRDDLVKQQTKGSEVICFNGMNFLPVNSDDLGFVPVRVEFGINKVPRLVDSCGNKIMAWNVL